MTGRPEFTSSDAQRAQVKVMAAFGVPQDDIAKVIGCSAPTLRKHFWAELETAAIEANSKVAQSLFRKAVEGTGKEAVTACIFWLKCRAGWRDVAIEPGKKEQIETIARAAEHGTDWERLLN